MESEALRYFCELKCKHCTAFDWNAFPSRVNFLCFFCYVSLIQAIPNSWAPCQILGWSSVCGSSGGLRNTQASADRAGAGGCWQTLCRSTGRLRPSAPLTGCGAPFGRPGWENPLALAHGRSGSVNPSLPSSSGSTSWASATSPQPGLSLSGLSSFVRPAGFPLWPWR